jgi:thiol-disulfide isomerase/thioredoxin
MNAIRQLLAAIHPSALSRPIEALGGDGRVVPEAPSSNEGELRSLGSATEWLNSPPLTAAGLRGKVVLIEFWTYTCINWLRVQPYVRAWDEKFKERGLAVIGVHAPEFSFEHNIDNVRRAAEDLRVDYPFAIDNDFAIWRAFNNHYWPALYFVDAQGRVRDQQFGEGEYERSELNIRGLLAETGISNLANEPVSVDARGVEAPADWDSLRSPETYVGYDRMQNFASPGGSVLNEDREYAVPGKLRLNQWALGGNWTTRGESALLNESGGLIAHRFHARDLHLVMGSAVPGASVPFRVQVDGQPPYAAHGLDVDDEGNGSVSEPRLYQLIRQPGAVAERTFEITFLDPGIEAYAFTFG